MVRAMSVKQMTRTISRFCSIDNVSDLLDKSSNSESEEDLEPISEKDEKDSKAAQMESEYKKGRAHGSLKSTRGVFKRFKEIVKEKVPDLDQTKDSAMKQQEILQITLDELV